jgi:uncharacterized protein with HEPN domain
MPRDYKVFLEDILEAIEKIRRYTSGFSQDALCKDDKTLDAVVRNPEVIGEAVKRVPAKNPLETSSNGMEKDRRSQRYPYPRILRHRC